MSTRRKFLSLAGAALALAPLGPSAAGAQAALVGAIRVDATPLAEQGWGAGAALAKAELERALIANLGPAYRRGAGPTLVVTLNSMWLASYAGNGAKIGSAGSSNDYLNSVATLVDRRGRELARYPIMSTELSSSGGAWHLPGIDQRRILALARNNALWIKRYVAG